MSGPPVCVGCRGSEYLIAPEYAAEILREMGRTSIWRRRKVHRRWIAFPRMPGSCPPLPPTLTIELKFGYKVMPIREAE